MGRVCTCEQAVVCGYLCGASKVPTNLIFAYKLKSEMNCIFQRDELYFPDKARCPKIDIYEKILNIKSVINEFSSMHYTEKGTSLLTRHQKIVCKWPLALGICGHSKKMFSVNMIQDLFSKTMDLLFCAVMMGLRFMLLYLLH